jgi:hypothetical protein
MPMMAKMPPVTATKTKDNIAQWVRQSGPASRNYCSVDATDAVRKFSPIIAVAPDDDFSPSIGQYRSDPGPTRNEMVPSRSNSDSTQTVAPVSNSANLQFSFKQRIQSFENDKQDILVRRKLE